MLSHYRYTSLLPAALADSFAEWTNSDPGKHQKPTVNGADKDYESL